MKKLTHILVGTDFSEASAHAMTVALAHARRDGASVTVAHVAHASIQEAGWPVYMAMDWHTAHRQVLDRLEERLVGWVKSFETFDVEISTTASYGWAPALLDQIATDRSCDLIVVSAGDATRLERFLIGSVAEDLVREATHDVLIVRDTGREGVARVLVGIDFSPNADAALTFAKDRAMLLDARLDVAYIAKDPGETSFFKIASKGEQERLRGDLLQDEREKFEAWCEPRQWATREFETHLLLGAPDKRLAEYAAAIETDLLVVGAKGSGTLRKLVLGSTAERLIRNAPCSVAVIRG